MSNSLNVDYVIRSKSYWKSLTWKERLFSWPWKPWIKKRYVKNPVFANNTCCIIGNDLVLTNKQLNIISDEKKCTIEFHYK